MISAGRPELANALRYQAQGVRNLVQGEWGLSFVNTLEKVMDTRVVSVLTSVQARLDEQISLVAQLLAVHKETARGLKKLQAQMKESQGDRRKIHQEVANVKSEVAAIQARLDRQDEIERRLVALEARDGLPTG